MILNTISLPHKAKPIKLQKKKLVYIWRDTQNDMALKQDKVSTLGFSIVLWEGGMEIPYELWYSLTQIWYSLTNVA
jgi:hypothetical protein